MILDYKIFRNYRRILVYDQTPLDAGLSLFRHFRRRSISSFSRTGSVFSWNAEKILHNLKIRISFRVRYRRKGCVSPPYREHFRRAVTVCGSIKGCVSDKKWIGNGDFPLVLGKSWQVLGHKLEGCRKQFQWLCLAMICSA